MTASVYERIAEAVKTALTGQVSGISLVERDREDLVARDEGDSINITTDAANTKPFGEAVDDNELTIDVHINVRGDPFETRADAYAKQVHGLVTGRNYAGDGLKLARMPRLVQQDWTGEAGDETPGTRTMKYAFRFLTLAADISAQP
ncbi:MAG TPA: hypothetical protein VN667_17910 [Burkholderiales bacterium]|nr:hypothetical protein [Burkholderiales bacterium]